MSLLVLKFGGTSVESPAQILAVARTILRHRDAGHAVLVVVSAMGQKTDELLHLARRVSRAPGRRELDMLLSVGERVSMALLAMALESLGCPAISFTGSQSGIVTDTRHSEARIQSVRPSRIRSALAENKVVIVAGFQGVSTEKEITTLGRGGSDTTAVALAVAFGAQSCRIYTDVPGVLSADPRVVPGARLLKDINFEPMITLSHLGGRVLFRRAAILARHYRIPLEVRSSTLDDPGTRLHDHPEQLPLPYREEEGPMETDRVLAVALESPVRWIQVLLRPSDREQVRPGPTEAPHFLNYHQSTLPDGSMLLQWIALPESDASPWNTHESWDPTARITIRRDLAVVSLIGEGVLTEASILSAAESTLRSVHIPIEGLFSGSLSLSYLVPVEHGDAAARALHRAFVEVPATN